MGTRRADLPAQLATTIDNGFAATDPRRLTVERECEAEGDVCRRRQTHCIPHGGKARPNRPEARLPVDLEGQGCALAPSRRLEALDDELQHAHAGGPRIGDVIPHVSLVAGRRDEDEDEETYEMSRIIHCI